MTGCRRRCRLGQILLERKIRQMRQRPRAAVTADAVAADLGLDVNVFVDLGVPVRRVTGEAEEGQAAHLVFRRGVAQLLAGVDDFLEFSLVPERVAIQEFQNGFLLVAFQISLLGVRSQ